MEDLLYVGKATAKKLRSVGIQTIRLEVFPSKISHKEDYQDMLQDLSNEIAGAVLDFMRNTYQEFSIGSTQSSVPALFFEIISRIFGKFQNAVNTIISSPHHKLYVEHRVTIQYTTVTATQ